MRSLRAILSVILVGTMVVPYSLSFRLHFVLNQAQAAPVGTRALLRLDRALYAADADCVRVTVHDADENAKPTSADAK